MICENFWRECQEPCPLPSCPKGRAPAPSLQPSGRSRHGLIKRAWSTCAIVGACRWDALGRRASSRWPGATPLYTCGLGIIINRASDTLKSAPVWTAPSTVGPALAWAASCLASGRSAAGPRPGSEGSVLPASSVVLAAPETRNLESKTHGDYWGVTGCSQRAIETAHQAGAERAGDRRGLAGPQPAPWAGS